MRPSWSDCARSRTSRRASFGHARSTWTLALLARTAHAEGLSAAVLSIETIRQALLRLEVGWKRAKRWLTSPDPAYCPKNAAATG